MGDSDYTSGSDSDGEYTEWSLCNRAASGAGIPFDPTAISNIILTLSEQFDLRVVIGSERAASALMITSGLALAGSVLGKHFAGNVGAALGGAVGGACGVGISAVSLSDLWEDAKYKLWELYDVVYDYVAGMGLSDYKTAASLLAQGGSQGPGAQLAQILAEVASGLLKKKVITSIQPQ